MTPLSPVGSTPTARPEPSARRGAEDRAAPCAPTPARGPDLVELSDRARRAGRTADEPIRADLVKQVRTEIEAGTYVTPAKIDFVVTRLSQHASLFA